jgi:Holliday junction resolvase RusA-like endonuclease
MLITIPGKPIAKNRPRFARRGKFVQTYSDQETEAGKFYLQARMQCKSEPLECPLMVRMSFFLPRPKSHYGTGRNAGKLKSSAPPYPDKKPDVDNYEKFAADCLNGLAWKDDSQVVDCHSKKRYSENPRTVIEIKPMEEWE